MKIRKVIWHERFYYIIGYFIILLINIDILLAGLVKQERILYFRHIKYVMSFYFSIFYLGIDNIILLFL
jgi:hypothetical protein